MILYGAGGHAKVVYHTLISNGVKVQGIFDDNPAITSFLGRKVIPYSNTKDTDSEVIICIGCNKIRHVISQKIKHPFGQLVDSTSYLADGDSLGQGSIMLAKSIVQANISVGKHAIINSGAIVEHDCVVSDFVHVGPGAVVCANAHMGFGAFIGANATILPGISIGDWAVVGAGSVVTKDVAANTTVAGTPAKTI